MKTNSQLENTLLKRVKELVGTNMVSVDDFMKSMEVLVKMIHENNASINERLNNDKLDAQSTVQSIHQAAVDKLNERWNRYRRKTR